MKKRLFTAFCMVLAVALQAAGSTNFIGRSWRFTWPTPETPYESQKLDWLQAESLQLEYLATDATNSPIDLSNTNLVVLWEVVSYTNLDQCLILNTGTVATATNGHVRFTVTPADSNLDTNYYLGFVTANEWEGTNLVGKGVLARQTIKVAFSTDSRFYSLVGPLTHAYTETDPIWSAASGTVAAALAAAATGTPVYVEADPIWSASSGTVAAALAAAATGTPIYVEADPVWESEKAAYATGTPLYAYTETDPVWESEKASYATGTPLYAYTETDPVWESEKASYATGTPLYAYTETDPIWSAASGTVAAALAAAATGTPVYVEADPIWSASSGTVAAALAAAATGTPIYVEADPVWESEKAAYATGTPLYAYTETDPVWESEKASYATGTPLYAYTETDPVWESEKAAYATGTPLYAYTETDPVWESEKAAYATGTPLYAYTETDPVWESEKAAYATGTPLYAYTETDPVWIAASGTVAAALAAAATGTPVYVEADPVWTAVNGDQRYASKNSAGEWQLIASDLAIDSEFTNLTVVITGGCHSVKTEAESESGQLVYVGTCLDDDDWSAVIGAGTSTWEVLSTCSTSLVITAGLPPPGGGTGIISAVYYRPFALTDTLNTTNDLRASTVFVREAVADSEPVTKGVFDAAIAAIRVDLWSTNPAVSAVDFDGNDILFGNNFSAETTTNAFSILFGASTFLRFLAADGSAAQTGETYIVSASVTSTQIVIGAFASPGWEPIPEYSVDGDAWAAVTNYTTTYPTTLYGVVTLTFPPPTNEVCLVRAVVTADEDYSGESTLEVTADNLLILGRRLIINDTNGAAVVMLSATGGLKVGSASFNVDTAGNISQDSTNTAELGRTTISEVVSNLTMSAISGGAPGYSYAVRFLAAGFTNFLSAYNKNLYIYDSADTNRLLGWRTRIVTEGALADGIVDGGLKIGTNSFELDSSGALAADWNLGGNTISNGTVAGYVSSSDLAETLGSYATGTPLYAYTETDPVWESEKAAYATGTPLYAYTETDPIWAAASNAVAGLFGYTNRAASALASSVWAAADSTTNYQNRIAAAVTNAAVWAALAGKATGTPLYVESDPIWAAASNAVAGLFGYTNRAASALASSVWAAADSTTNYAANNGPIFTGDVTISRGTNNSVLWLIGGITNGIGLIANSSTLRHFTGSATNTIWTSGNLSPSIYYTLASYQQSATNGLKMSLVAVPASNTASGAKGQVAINETNLFIFYSPSNKWWRITGGTLEW